MNGEVPERPPPELCMIPLEQIEILNPGERNNRMFGLIIENI